MTTTLTFEQVNGEWVYKFVSQGACVIELERDNASLVTVKANVEGMESVPVASFQNAYVTNAIFEIDLPEGIEVTVTSQTEVKSAKMLA